MWDKFFRSVLVYTVYQDLFWKGFGSSYEVDLDFTLANIRIPEDSKGVDLSQIPAFVDEISKNSADYVDYLHDYLKNWEKTYLLVQAILFVFLLEKSKIEEAGDELSEVVGKYIRLTQDLVGGKNTALVHAVISKVLEGKQ